MDFKFQVGKKKRDLSFYVMMSLLVKNGLDLLGKLLPFLSKRHLFLLLDAIQKHFKLEPLNDYIVKDEELLDLRVEHEVDKAIEEYKELTKKEEPSILPVFTDDGVEMRLRAPWVKE